MKVLIEPGTHFRLRAIGVAGAYLGLATALLGLMKGCRVFIILLLPTELAVHVEHWLEFLIGLFKIKFLAWKFDGITSLIIELYTNLSQWPT